MSELTFEQMLDESFKTIRTGEVVSGEVIDVEIQQDGLVSRLLAI